MHSPPSHLLLLRAPLIVRQLRSYSRLKNLKHSSLLRPFGFVNGEFLTNKSELPTFPVVDPATSEEICTIPNLGTLETIHAIETAQEAFNTWKETTAKERSSKLRKWYELVVRHKEDLATILTAESGKPITESHGEVLYGASFMEWFAEEAKRMDGDIIPEPTPGRRIMVFQEPVGVAALITPWNFPIAMITRKAAAAIAAGCSVVIKPASETPLSAMALCELANRAGIPKGVINVVPCSHSNVKDVGATLTTHPFVKKVSFTGSTTTGKLLMQQSSSTVKKLSLELGGNAPFIVFEDADIDKAVEGCVNSKFRNTGQTCVCVNRIYVHRQIYDEFTNKLVERVKALKIGSPFDKSTQIGPLINTKAVNKVDQHVQNALKEGAKLLTGGKRLTDLGPNWYEPTVLADVPDSCTISTEETFGPVAAVFPFQSEEEVIQRANNTEFGLAGYFYSRDVSRIFRVARKLQTGMVGVNEGLISTEVAPFGGVKQSGFGREGSKYGLREYTHTKYVCLGGLAESA